MLPQLEHKGKVVRGYVGLTVQRVTPDIAEALGIDKARGALVAEVVNGGPAERAGIRGGDVIVGFNGKEVKDSSALPSQVARIAPGTSVTVKLLRDSKELSLPVTVGVMEEKTVAAKSESGDFGLVVEPVTAEIARELGRSRAEGVVVTTGRPGSPADDAGIEHGDVIVEIDRKPVHTLSDYKQALAKTDQQKPLLLRIDRGQNSLFLAMKR